MLKWSHSHGEETETVCCPADIACSRRGSHSPPACRSPGSSLASCMAKYSLFLHEIDNGPYQGFSFSQLRPLKREPFEGNCKPTSFFKSGSNFAYFFFLIINKNKHVQKIQIPNQQYKCICQQTTWNHCEIIFICWTFHFVLLCIWQSMNLRSQQNNSIVVLHFHLSSGCPWTGRKPRETSSRGRSPKFGVSLDRQEAERDLLPGPLTPVLADAVPATVHHEGAHLGLVADHRRRDPARDVLHCARANQHLHVVCNKHTPL